MILVLRCLVASLTLPSLPSLLSCLAADRTSAAQTRRCLVQPCPIRRSAIRNQTFRAFDSYSVRSSNSASTFFQTLLFFLSGYLILSFIPFLVTHIINRNLAHTLPSRLASLLFLPRPNFTSSTSSTRPVQLPRRLTINHQTSKHIPTYSDTWLDLHHAAGTG